MNKKIITWILFFVLCGLVAFAGGYVVSQQMLVRMLTITYNRVELANSVSLTRMALNIYLNFYNPSQIDVNVYGYDFDVFINEKHITKLLSNDPGYIKGEAVSVVKLEVVANPLEILGNLFSKEVINGLLFDYSKVIVRLTGTINADHRGIGMKAIPVDISDTLQNLLYGASKTS